jgi:hypothetical protein
MPPSEKRYALLAIPLLGTVETIPHDACIPGLGDDEMSNVCRLYFKTDDVSFNVRVLLPCAPIESCGAVRVDTTGLGAKAYVAHVKMLLAEVGLNNHDWILAGPVKFTAEGGLSLETTRRVKKIVDFYYVA